jgi:hypothetical protein
MEYSRADRTPNDTAFYGYAPDANNSNYQNLFTPTDYTKNNYCNFYWSRAAGPQVVKCTATVYGQAVTTYAILNLLRPTNVNLAASNQSPLQVSTLYASAYASQVPISGDPYLCYGLNRSSQYGIYFTPTGSSPSGSAGTNEWIQTINTTYVNRITSSGSHPHTTSGLDTYYPDADFDQTGAAYDSPAGALVTDDMSATRSGTFTTYWMWKPYADDPALNGDNTIWVPLRSYQWSFNESCTNAPPTPDNSTGWAISASSTNSPAPNIDATNEPIQMALNPGLLNGTIPLTSYPLQTSQVNWQYREMNGDGTFTDWTNFQATPEGPEFNYTTTLGGIYQVQAIITVNGASETWQYNRQQDDPNGSDSDGNFNPIYAKGQPDYFGVVDSQWQIDVRNQARALLGSTAYSKAGSLPPIYPGGPTLTGDDKCNVFVYQMCNAAGDAPISLIRTYKGLNYPPLTIDWYDGAGAWEMPWVDTALAIPGWASLGQPTWPEPGYVVSRPAYNPVNGEITGGHAGILDYDGAWINAGTGDEDDPGTINRYPNITPPGNSYNNPEHCSYHTP